MILEYEYQINLWIPMTCIHILNELKANFIAMHIKYQAAELKIQMTQIKNWFFFHLANAYKVVYKI